MFSSIWKRYGARGIVWNVLLKAVGAVSGLKHLQIHRMLAREVNAGDEADAAPGPFRELRYADFVQGATNDPVRLVPDYLSQLQNRFGQPGYLCFGCVERGVVAAYGWISLNVFPRTDKKLKPADGVLFDDYTNPAFRGRGLHRGLIDYRLRQLAAHGKTRALAFVDIYNRASYRGFLVCGFRCEQRFVKYFRKGKEISKLRYE